MKPKKQITLEDIAAQLNLSKVAVSKALRDHPDISEDTKNKVRQLAKDLGYFPNIIARNLSARQSNTIGLVVPKIAHHFFARAIEAIYEIAFEQNYEIIMTVSQENSQFEALHIQNLLSLRVDGLLVSVTEQTIDHSIFETVKDWGVPLVFFDRVLENLGFSCVTTSDFNSSLESVSKLIKRGFSNIPHIAGYQHTNIGKNRAEGYKAAFEQATIELPENGIVYGGFGEHDGYLGFHNLLKKNFKPEVVFTVTYPVALGVLLAAEELGIQVPGDLEIISFGGSNYNRFIKPSLTYIDQPGREIAVRSIKLLIEEIQSME